jgi:hypothetical protein
MWATTVIKKLIEVNNRSFGHPDRELRLSVGLLTVKFFSALHYIPRFKNKNYFYPP